MYGSLTFSPPRNFAVFDGWYFLQYCLLKIVQIAQVNQLLIIEFRQYIWPQLLRVKSYANEEKCKQWHQQRVAYKYPYGLISYKKSRKSTLLVNYLIRPHTTTNFHLHTTVTATIGHFRVARSLCFKARLNSKLSIRIGFFFLTKIKLISTRKVFYLASTWKSEFLELENGLLYKKLRRRLLTGHVVCG